MLKIEKTPEPIFFQKVRENPKVRKWEDVPPEIKKELNRHISEQEQLYNGICLCPYCERKIKVKASHIEHIRPKSIFPSLTFSYNNLMVSCNDPNTCGHYKDHSWKDTFINPVEDPVPCFHYSAEGKIREEDERVKDTVSILNLNHSALVDIRRKMFIYMNCLSTGFIKEFDKYIDEFPSLIHYYLKSYNREI